MGLVVKGEAVDLGLGEGREVVGGVGDHEVAVEVDLGHMFAEGRNDGRTYG